ncbi:MAG: FliM/FliN family flagellar motor switch protein [Sandaracinobacteroides sp.]
MNAIPPKGQMPRTAQESVRLTMDFDDEPEADGNPELQAGGDQFAEEPASASRGSSSGPDGHDDAPPNRRARAAEEPSADLQERPAGRQSAASQPGRQGAQMPASLAGIEVMLSVEVGNLKLPLKDLLSVEPGRLFALDRMTSEPVTVLVNGKPFARGEIVAIGERFGVRLLEIVPAGNGEGGH